MTVLLTAAYYYNYRAKANNKDYLPSAFNYIIYVLNKYSGF